MGIVGIGFVFIICWWMIFFAALPFGVRGHREAGEPVPHGAEAAAPIDPKLMPKALATTAIAAVVTALVWAAVTFHLLDGLAYY